jgi:membrane protease YdiL (CAAX protease family)
MGVQAISASSGSPDEQRPMPWGFWSTLGFSCVIGACSLVCGTLFVLVLVVLSRIRNPHFDIEQFAGSLEKNGLFLAGLICVMAPPAIGLILLFAKIRRNITVRQYLSLHNPGWRQVCRWFLLLVLYAAVVEAISFLLTFAGRPFTSESMIRMYSTGQLMPLLWFAMVVVAPVSEELFFRGFLFKGIEGSRMGPVGAVIITSLVWSALHAQLDAFALAGTFVGGLLLGWALLKTRSVYIPIIMHTTWNLIATIEVALYLKLA